MKVLTITTSYEITKMTARGLAAKGHGQFIEKLDDTPMDVYKNIDWINSLHPTRKLYHLEYLDEIAVVTEHQGAKK